MIYGEAGSTAQTYAANKGIRFYKTSVASPAITRLVTASGKVNVSWTPVTGATRYRVYYKISGGQWQAVNVSKSKTSYTVSGLQNNKGYAFLVRAEVGGKFTKYSDMDMRTAVPNIPGRALNPSITKVTAGNGKVNVQWTPVKGATRYRVYYKVSGGQWQAKNIAGTQTSYTVSGLTNNKGYAFLVRAEVNGAFTKYNGAHMVTAVPTASKSSSIDHYETVIPFDDDIVVSDPDDVTVFDFSELVF